MLRLWTSSGRKRYYREKEIVPSVSGLRTASQWLPGAALGAGNFERKKSIISR